MSKKDLSVQKLKSLDSNKKFIQVYPYFKTQLKQYLKKNNFLVAVSGGPDSLALSVLSQKYAAENKTKAFFILIDHKIRKNSSREALWVQKLFKSRSMNLKIIKNTQKINNNIQAEARKVRYELLSNFCLKKKIKFILTAHHRDDQVETFLIRLSRGSGIQGLSSMDKIVKLNNKVSVFRPLLDLKKEDLLSISKSYFGKVVKDPSNEDNKYLRTKIRRLVQHFEKSGIDLDRVNHSIKNLAASRDILNSYIQGIEKKCVLKRKNQIFINLNFFLKEKQDIQLKILGNCIKQTSKAYYPPRAKKVINLLQKIRSKSFLKATLGNCFIEKKEKNLIIRKE
jgi:tRNA(Ile)-lysidine synthase